MSRDRSVAQIRAESQERLARFEQEARDLAAGSSYADMPAYLDLAIGSMREFHAIFTGRMRDDIDPALAATYDRMELASLEHIRHGVSRQADLARQLLS